MNTWRDLFLNDPKAYKSALLSSDQLDLFREVDSFNEAGITSSDIASIFEISVQSASARLKVLVKKGYLRREQFISESGGIEYIYYAKESTVP